VPQKGAAPAASEVVSEQPVEPAAEVKAAPESESPVPAPAKVAGPVVKAPEIATVTVSVSSNPEGAAILQGDKIHGFTPLVILLPEGKDTIQLILSKAGFLPHTLELIPDKGHVLETDLARKPTRAVRPKRTWAKPRSTPVKAGKKVTKLPKPVAAPKPIPKPKPKKRIDVLLD